MSALNRDLRLTVAAAVLCATVVVAVPVTPVRVLFAVPLCLILPGYALTLPTTGGGRVPPLVFVMLVPSLSLVALVLGSLLLNVLPGGLNEASWAVLMVVVVVAGCAVAAYRGTPTRPAVRWRMPRLPMRQVSLLAAALLLSAGALVLSRIPLGAPNAIGYTQLWMFSTGTPAAPRVSIGITCAEQHPTAYRVVVSTGSGTPVVVASHLRLRPGHTTNLNIPLHGVPGPTSLVTTLLYRVGRPAVYRRVTALVSSTLPLVPARVSPTKPHVAPRRATTRPNRAT